MNNLFSTVKLYAACTQNALNALKEAFSNFIQILLQANPILLIKNNESD